ncbi:MAG: sugar MFS transporter [Cytophagales bacterium]|nr:sugar MFS transporter [Cytophagales bacterium]MDW8384233.1 sugar MFS transporter [Flammeovirgaceae bacterium]
MRFSSHTIALISVVSLFFLFGFVTALNDVLIPHLKGIFQLSVMQSMLVQFCFFGAYFLMSIPAGWVLVRIGNQNGIVFALTIVGIGLLLFIPASKIVSYEMFLLALFIVASGITMLQVAANPYLSLLGPIETATARINLAGGLNSLATTLAPWVGAQLILIESNASPEVKAAATHVPYIGLSVFVLCLAILFGRIRLPIVVVSATELSSFFVLLKFPKLLQGALAIFAYVGAEVAIGSLLIGYLALPENGALSSQEAAIYVSYYWGTMMIGRWIGFLFLSKISSKTMLVGAVLGAFCAISVALMFQGTISVWALVTLGLFHAVMWPCIFPISIQGLENYTNQGAALLIMMVVGGALIPLLQGWIIDHYGYRYSFLIEMCCYAWIGWFALSPQKNVLK